MARVAPPEESHQQRKLTIAGPEDNKVGDHDGTIAAYIHTVYSVI